ncbi:N-acetylmannosamine kinase [Paraconexibacter sp. AEG42_29]|uniref:N-acetylmannosamine kinase n=1 Tax=Paraconexibacter sp. AEG42_29 TaxID=2997339 RepID=A0AAU7APM4_9ACTN
MTLRGGIDLGGTKIQAVVVDADHAVRGQARRPTPVTGGPQDVADAMAAALTDAADAAGVAPSDLAAIGAGSPGGVDAAAGTVSAAGNLPGWSGTFALAGALQTALGPRVALGNDVNVATEAEFRLGTGRPYSSLLGVFWGTGVGGGIVLNDAPWFGRGAAGEIGHVVVERGGRRCPCGRKGCMEAYAGRSAMEAHARRRVEKGDRTKLFKLMEEHGRPRLTSGIWARALEAGDHLAEELIEEAIAALGVGVASTVNVLDVEAIVLGGGMGVRFGETFMPRLREAMAPHLFSDQDPPVLEVAALGDLGGAIGAALLVA